MKMSEELMSELNGSHGKCGGGKEILEEIQGKEHTKEVKKETKEEVMKYDLNSEDDKKMLLFEKYKQLKLEKEQQYEMHKREVMSLKEDLEIARNELSLKDELIRLLRLKNEILSKEAAVLMKLSLSQSDSTPDDAWTSVADVPNEVLELMMRRYLGPSEVMAAGMTSRRMLSICRPVWQRKRAAEIEQKWSYSDYTPSAAEVNCASLLAKHGHLPSHNITLKAYFVAKSLNQNPSQAQVQCGAALATQGYITQVETLWLHDKDISLVPAEDLASLVKCVTDEIYIDNVTGDMAPVFSNAKCRRLDIYRMNLSTADTKHLLTAMVSGVKQVWPSYVVTLDMETLAQYDGKGECEEVWFGDGQTRYGDQMKVWAGNIGWQIEEEEEDSIIIKKE